MPERCPECGAECTREEVDIGVGVQYGPWYCTGCPWSEASDQDDLESVDQTFNLGEPRAD